MAKRYRQPRSWARFLAERDADWDTKRARYGMSMPQYHKPDDFPRGKWELWATDYPGAINVVAWRESLEPKAEAAPEPDPIPVEGIRQLSLF